MSESTHLDHLRAAIKAEHEEEKSRFFSYGVWAKTLIALKEGQGSAPTFAGYLQWRRGAMAELTLL